MPQSAPDIPLRAANSGVLPVVIRKKENRPEAADHVRSKTRNQRRIDYLQSTSVSWPACAGKRYRY